MGHYVKFPEWNSAIAEKGGYQKGSRVYYEPTAPNGEHQPTGYGYVANDLINQDPYKSLPPVQPWSNPAWNLHPYYAPLWDENRQYKEGDRVFFIVSKEDPKVKNIPNIAFIYRASLRYIVGKQPPNKALDSQGIRTWELVTIPLSESELKDTRPLLAPVKKKRGIWQNPDTMVGRDNRFQLPVYYPEEGSGGDWIEPPLYDENEDPIPRYPLEYAKWNTSILQASPYNTNVYTNQGVKQDESGGLVVFNTGTVIHWAKYVHDYGPLSYGVGFQALPAEQRAFWNFADRQFIHTLYQSSYSELYRDGGFSLEMWGTLEPNDFEFINHGNVPVAGNDVSYNPMFQSSFPAINVAMSGNNYIEVHGDLKDGDGNITLPKTDTAECKREIYIYINNVSFHDRRVTVNFEVISLSYHWEKQFYYYIDGTQSMNEDGTPYFTWRQVYNKDSIFTTQRVYYTSPSVYNGTATGYGTGYEIASGDTSMNFDFLRIENQTSYVRLIGFKYD